MFSVVLVEHAYTNMMMEPVQAFLLLEDVV